MVGWIAKLFDRNKELHCKLFETEKIRKIAPSVVQWGSEEIWRTDLIFNQLKEMLSKQVIQWLQSVKHGIILKNKVWQLAYLFYRGKQRTKKSI